MKLILRYMKPFAPMVALAILIKFTGTIFELSLPYILEYMIDEVVPEHDLNAVVRWGLLLFLAALLTWLANVLANRTAIFNSHRISYRIRQDLFVRTTNLSGRQFDSFGLPSLISRMTSDSYNVQTGVQQLQSLCVRAPMMLVGGVFMMLMMDFQLSLVLICMLPFLLAIMIGISAYGIPLYHRVQQRLDDIVRIMRESITGIRVVKALSKTEYEKQRFHRANDNMMAADIRAGMIMAVPGPFMQTCLGIGLTLVVFVGAKRVNEGLTQPGVILAFLTYFHMITMGIMGLTRIFISLSKASASADRIRAVIDTQSDQRVLTVDEAKKPSGDEFIRFEDVTFSYLSDFGSGAEPEERQAALTDISFAIRRGESLGIIGPTGCGKTTIINLLMRFYDATEGGIFVDGRDVRTYEQDELHRKFGTVFQNDIIFQDTLRENIGFDRNLSETQLQKAVEQAQAAEFIHGLEDGLEHKASIKGANLSGGQKQRVYIARALAGNPEILILDDSSSALDYKTDAALRKAIAEGCSDTTLIMIAQRVSSIMNLSHIMVMDNGHCIGYGAHQELLETCMPYREIYETQMGAMN